MVGLPVWEPGLTIATVWPPAAARPYGSALLRRYCARPLALAVVSRRPCATVASRRLCAAVVARRPPASLLLRGRLCVLVFRVRSVRVFRGFAYLLLFFLVSRVCVRCYICPCAFVRAVLLSVTYCVRPLRRRVRVRVYSCSFYSYQ